MKIAVVTGASSGIGREFVRQLDSRGFDEIWGIGLGENLLAQVKAETKTKFRPFELDLTDDKNFEVYVNALKENDVNIAWLVNCSGFGKFGRYDEINIEASANMIDLNCKALVKMTELSIPYMKKGSHIVEIASVAGFQPTPYLNVYAATKAFVLSYARALNVELKSKGIKVTCVCPFWTKTAFFKRATETTAKHEVVTKYVAMYKPENVVKKAIKDTEKGKEKSICGFIARSQVRMVNMLPKKLVMSIWVHQQKLNKKYK